MTNKSNLFYKRKAILLPLLFLSLFLLFTVSVKDVSATPVNTIYVNDSGGNDASDGSSWLLAKKSIKNATGTVKTNGTVKIANGQYSGVNNTHITIDKNMKISGQTETGTVINGTDSNWIFHINNGITVNISNLTITNGKGGQDNVIFNSGTLTIDESSFTSNTADNVNGGVIYNNGTLDVNDSIFTGNIVIDGNGGAIYNNGTLNVNNSNFTSNTADNVNGGISSGGAIYNNGTLNVNNCNFTSNSAADGNGGAIVNEGTLTVTNSDFTSNTAKFGFGFGGVNSGGAIYNNGISTVDNCNFTNNAATEGFGGSNIGGAIYNNATMNVKNSTFTTNYVWGKGGAIYNEGTLTVDNCTFTSNSANAGGAIYNTGTLTVKNSTFTDNNASDTAGGGAIKNNGGTITLMGCTFVSNRASGYMGGGGAINNTGTLTVKNSTFTNNTASFYGGAIYNTGTATVNFNRIIGNRANFGSSIYNTNGGSTDAKYNWWGSNTSPGGMVNGDVSYDPWIVLTVTSKPAAIVKGDNSRITADLLHDSNGGYHDPVNGHVPDGLTVIFSSDSNGTVNPVSSITTNGQANTTFTGLNPGISIISATLDSETMSTNVTINKTTTKVNIGPVSGLKGHNVNLTARLTDNHNDPVKDAEIQFNINGTFVGTSKTNSNGIATLNYLITQDNGTYTILAEYLGDTVYVGSSNTGMLTVTSTPVNPVYKLYLQISSSNNHPTIGETFTLTYKLGNKGPDSANNVTVTIPIPVGFSVSNITGDGNWIYNRANNTITWTLTSVPVGDPYLYVSGKTVKAGQYIFGSSLSSETLKLNSAEVIPTYKTTSKTDGRSTNTITMQHTGVPIAGLLLAILMVFGGYIIPRLKK